MNEIEGEEVTLALRKLYRVLQGVDEAVTPTTDPARDRHTETRRELSEAIQILRRLAGASRDNYRDVLGGWVREARFR